jgi:hypothetical protein
MVAVHPTQPGFTHQYQNILALIWAEESLPELAKELKELGRWFTETVRLSEAGV